VLDERASVVIDAEDLLVNELFGEVLSEEGGEGGGGDVGDGEAEDVSDLSARIELGVLSKQKRRVALEISSIRERGCRWIIRRARNTRESLYTWLLAATFTRSSEL